MCQLPAACLINFRVGLFCSGGVLVEKFGAETLLEVSDMASKHSYFRLDACSLSFLNWLHLILDLQYRQAGSAGSRSSSCIAGPACQYTQLLTSFIDFRAN